jgi:hypothetical protein
LIWRLGLFRLIIVVLVLVINAGCGNNETDDVKIFTHSYGVLGVSNGREASFYETSGKKWYNSDYTDFVMPENDDFLSIGLRTIGVIKDGVIQFYDIMDKKNWKKSDLSDFHIPENDYLISIYMRVIGVVNGREIEFWVFDKESNKWVHDESRLSDFEIPYDGKIIPLMINPLGTASLGIIHNKKLHIFHFNHDAKEWFASDLDFDLEDKPNRQFVSVGFGSLGVMDGNRIKFYPLELYINNEIIRGKNSEFVDFVIK